MKISYRQNDFMYSYDRTLPPELRLHLHNYYEFLLFKSGDAGYLVENTLYKANSGDLFITRPDEIHTITFQSDAVYERHFIQISPDYLNNTGIDLMHLINKKKPGTYNRIDAKIVKSYGIDEYFTSVEQYVVNRTPESDLMIKTYIIQMMAKINSALREYSAAVEPKQSGDTRIMEIKRFIDNNIRENLSLEMLCENFYLSKYHLCRTFKSFTGLTVNEYINTRRITVAKQMIFEGCPLTTVCYNCGFGDYSTFYKAFRRYTNSSPREFFKEHRRN